MALLLPLLAVGAALDAGRLGWGLFNALDWPVWAIQLILPIFSVTLSLHALSNLIEDLDLQPKRTHAEFNIANADAVN